MSTYFLSDQAETVDRNLDTLDEKFLPKILVRTSKARRFVRANTSVNDKACVQVVVALPVSCLIGLGEEPEVMALPDDDERELRPQLTIFSVCLEKDLYDCG